MIELDHVFVLVDGAMELPGRAVSARRRHAGQGTANVCYALGNAYLELLWVVDPEEAGSPAVARTRLLERSDWRRTGASRFGVALRGALPFPTWPYGSLAIATDCDDPRQPLIFGTAGQPGPAGEGHVEALELPCDNPCSALQALLGAGLVRSAAQARLILRDLPPIPLEL